jgi:hypothetical protein
MDTLLAAHPLLAALAGFIGVALLALLLGGLALLSRSRPDDDFDGGFDHDA